MKDDESSQPARLPPTTHNLSERAFRPGLSFGQPIEGLNDTVMRLYNQGRFRSALDEIFKILDKDPDNPQALDLALIVAGGIRTTRIQAQEPLTPAYLLDRRLDPIVTVCSRCGKAWIGGDPLLMPGFQLFQFAVMINSGAPRPMQCYNCGYVLCSECIIGIMSDDPLAPQDIPETCPNCGQDMLKRPAYPTGRPPQQMARHSEPVAQVIVFREGPVPPDEAFLKGFLEPISPDALTDRAKLVGIPVFPWPSNIEAMSLSTLAQKEARGEIPPGSAERAEFAHAKDEHGNRIYIAKLLMPPSRASHRNLPKRTGLNPFSKYLADLNPISKQLADYSFVKDENGIACGIWLRDPSALDKPGTVETLLIMHNHSHLLNDYLNKRYRKVPNNYDLSGGCFVMFGSVNAPGETTSGKRWWQFWK